MKLWLIKADTSGYDVYSDAVVLAETEEEAKRIHPGGELYDDWLEKEDSFADSWVSSPQEVTATYLGEASPDFKAENNGVVCASFHAG